MDHSDEEPNLVDSKQFQKYSVSSLTSPVKRRRTPGSDTDQVMVSNRCISCGYSGYSVGALARHRLRHSAWSLSYCCRLCCHRATTRRLLTKHVKTHYRQSTAGPTDQQHACSHCPYKSFSATQVAEHERFHGAGLIYRCPYCLYSLNSRQLLIQHRRLHDTDCKTAEQLCCPHNGCPFKCYEQDQLVSHVRQHATRTRLPGTRLHACDLCSFAVDSRNVLLHHQRLHSRRQ